MPKAKIYWIELTGNLSSVYFFYEKNKFSKGTQVFMGTFHRIELEGRSAPEWIGDYSTQLNSKLSFALSHLLLTQLIATVSVSNHPWQMP